MQYYTLGYYKWIYFRYFRLFHFKLFFIISGYFIETILGYSTLDYFILAHYWWF